MLSKQVPSDFEHLQRTQLGFPTDLKILWRGLKQNHFLRNFSKPMTTSTTIQCFDRELCSKSKVLKESFLFLYFFFLAWNRVQKLFQMEQNLFQNEHRMLQREQKKFEQNCSKSKNKLVKEKKNVYKKLQSLFQNDKMIT